MWARFLVGKSDQNSKIEHVLKNTILVHDVTCGIQKEPEVSAALYLLISWQSLFKMVKHCVVQYSGNSIKTA